MAGDRKRLLLGENTPLRGKSAVSVLQNRSKRVSGRTVGRDSSLGFSIPGSQTCRFGMESILLALWPWNYTTGFPGSPAYTRQSMDFSASLIA